MADYSKAAVLAAAREMAGAFEATWDTSANWANTADALATVIAQINSKLDGVQFAMLLAATGMAVRQSQKASEVEIGHD